MDEAGSPATATGPEEKTRMVDTDDTATARPGARYVLAHRRWLAGLSAEDRRAELLRDLDRQTAWAAQYAEHGVAADYQAVLDEYEQADAEAGRRERVERREELHEHRRTRRHLDRMRMRWIVRASCRSRPRARAQARRRTRRRAARRADHDPAPPRDDRRRGGAP
jgi:hypothetical protein